MCGSKPGASAPKRSSSERAKFVCPRCGNENLRDFRFCSVCGVTLGDWNLPRKIRPSLEYDRPYLKLSEWPFSMFYEKTQTYGQWTNYIMLLSVLVVIFVLYLAARGEMCLAGVIILAFVFLAYWYWSSGKEGADAWSSPENRGQAAEPGKNEEMPHWQRKA